MVAGDESRGQLKGAQVRGKNNQALLAGEQLAHLITTIDDQVLPAIGSTPNCG